MRTKHIVIHKDEIKKQPQKKTQKKTLLQKIGALFSPTYEINEHTEWLETYTRIPKHFYTLLPALQLRQICEKIDPIVLETLSTYANGNALQTLLKEIYTSVMAGYKPICRMGDNKNNKPVEHQHLVAMVKNFSSTHLPPLVIGHPENNFPAFGYVSKLKLLGPYLFARYQNVPNQLIDLVNDGFFNYVSISMSVPLERRFIQKTRLAHVGLCGGTPPAISCLGYLRFQPGDILETRDGLNDDQKQIIGTSFATIPYFAKSTLRENGYILIETAPYRIKLSPLAQKFQTAVLKATQEQEIPLILYDEKAQNPPSLGYLTKTTLNDGKLYGSFINIPEMVEQFVLDALETYTLILVCDIYKKNNVLTVTCTSVTMYK